jgi:Domain of unknown function (DUF6259)
VLAYAAVTLIVSAACCAAPPALTLSANRLTFATGDLSATSAVDRLVSAYWADTPDIWAARAWVELPADAAAVSAHQDPDGVEIIYPSFGGKPIRVRLVGTLDAGAGEVRWSLSVRNGTKGTLVGIAGPVLRDITDLPGGILYYPNRPGQLLRDPWKVLQSATTSMAYPVPASMQYMVYTGRRAGIAYHILDRGMVYKFLAFGGPEREVRVLQYPFLAPGQSWDSPPIVWQVLAGDWHAAADRYGAWFRTWAKKPQVSPQVKRLPTFGGIVIRARPVDDANIRDVRKEQEFGTYGRALTECLRLGRAGFQGMHLVGWFGRGHDTTYPDYEPAPDMGGVDGLKALISGMHDAHMLVTLYLNARLANVNGPALAAHPEWKVLEGEPPYWREKYGDQEFQVMCPASRGFQGKMRTEVLRVARDYRGDGVQLDQIGAATTLLCFDRAHGHRTPATAWAEGYPRMLSDLREAARKVSPEFWQWAEGAWEGAGQFVDLSQGGFWPQLPQAEYFPRLYRYTHPDHPLFGDPATGSVPYWAPTDIHRAMRIDGVVGPLFWTAQFMDDQGLTTDAEGEALWFRAPRQLVVTFRNLTDADRDLAARLDLRRTGQTGAPRSARALAAGKDVAVTVEHGRLEFTAPVPGRQVEAVLLTW